MPLRFVVHHEHRILSSANDTLDSGPCKDIAQKLLAMGAHYDEIGTDRGARAQDPVEGVPPDHGRMATRVRQLGHGPDLLYQDPLSLALFHADQIGRQVFINDVNKVQLGTAGASQKAGLTQSAMRTRRKIRRSDDDHVGTLTLSNRADLGKAAI
jgi:hypothetical protein